MTLPLISTQPKYVRTNDHIVYLDIDDISIADLEILIDDIDYGLQHCIEVAKSKGYVRRDNGIGLEERRDV